MIKNVVINQIREVVPVGETSLTLANRSLSTNEYVCYTLICCGDLTSPVSKLTIGFMVGSDEVIIAQYVNLNASELKTLTLNIVVHGNHRLFVRVSGATQNDIITLSYTAFILDNIEQFRT